MKHAVSQAVSIRSALEAAVNQLAPIHETARLDAEVLLSYVLEQPRYRPYAWPGDPFDTKRHARFRDLVQRRAAGVPVAYLTQRREFWSLVLEVSPATLIPRPETEYLVEIALGRIPSQKRCRLADLGTGCGAVALSLASERPQARVTATDISSPPLGVAMRNAQRLRIKNVVFRRGDWCQGLPRERYHVIVSNPPYVAEADPHLAQGDLRFEPHRALASGPDGLMAIRHIADGARFHLEDGGWLILEHGYDQGPAVRNILARLGYSRVKTHRDYGGHERVAEALWM